MSLKLNHSKDYHNLLNNVIENEINTPTNSNEVLWVQMGSELEIEGIAKHKISAIVRKDIEDILYKKKFKDFISREEYRWHSGYFWRIMKKNDYVNPDMARHVSSDPLGDQEIVPPKYTVNKNMMFLLDDMINVCKTMKEKAKGMKSFENIMGEKHMAEFYKQRKTMIKNCSNAIDSKTKIPKNTEIILLNHLSTVMGNTNSIGEIFQERIMDLMKSQSKFLNKKQTAKYQRGEKTSQNLFMKPIDYETACYLDYVGIQCTCESFRIRLDSNSNKFVCFDCDRIIPKQTIIKCMECYKPLMGDELNDASVNGKCPNCKKKITLPPNMIQ